MAKFSRIAKLSKEKAESMVIGLCEAIAATRDSREAAQLLTDLLGKQELEMVAKRLAVAELLLDGCSYEDIEKALKVSPQTIARVQLWLQDSGEGYRMVIGRTKKKRETREYNRRDSFRLSGIKKKYPLYYWPQIVLQYWIQNSTMKEKQEMKNILSKINKKRQINIELDRLLKQELKIRK